MRIAFTTQFVNMRCGHFLIESLQKAGMCLFLFGLVASTSQAQVGPAPIIVVQPLDKVVLDGGTASFEVVAVSVTTLHYQWQFNGADLHGDGATKRAYTIPMATLGNVGRYSVRIRNNGGTVTSSDAILSVIKSTPLTIISGRRMTNGFELQLSGPILSSYVILASTDLENWTAISTNSAPTGSVVFTDATATNRPVRFYRAIAR